MLFLREIKMKLLTSTLLVWLALTAPASLKALNVSPASDHIVCYFNEVKDGKPTDNILLFDLIVYRVDGIEKWRLNELWFKREKGEAYLVQPEFDASDDQYSALKALNDLHWEPGKSFECHYRSFAERLDVTLKGALVGDANGKPQWQLSGEGFTKEYDYGKKIPYALAQVEEPELKEQKLDRTKVLH
jgi:hypothetical protein